MSIISKNLGNAKKHNGQILEHNRHKPSKDGEISLMMSTLIAY